jgi:predicted nucleotidyltransferase
MHPSIRQIAREYKTQLIQLYGSGLESLILFGSYARGDYHNDSDVDFAIILKIPRHGPAQKFSKHHLLLLRWD